jgi:AraC family transcriptional regulator, regulatory protein of adaptative response / methylated-DNA-[protein]-cysteine methyltransferase
MAMDTDYQRIERAIRYLTENLESQPSLDDVADSVGLSSFHLQRLFRRFAGVSPKQFLQHLTVERAKDALDASQSVLDASLATGLSGPARLHDHFVTLEAMTPGEYKTGGEGLEIRYGTAQTPFGEMFGAQTPRGICALSFSDSGGNDEQEALRNQWVAARVVRDDAIAQRTAQQIFEGRTTEQPLRIVAAGTNFQIRVWRALLEIPFGAVRTYQEIARAIGAPASSRAVGNALAANPIAYLIPCHRVILSTGAVGQYRWQPFRKRALLAWERSRSGIA